MLYSSCRLDTQQFVGSLACRHIHRKDLTHKPDAKIYHLAQEAVNLPAEQILFIDNTLGHLTGAQKAGWQTHHYDSTDYTQSTQSLQQFLEANNLV